MSVCEDKHTHAHTITHTHTEATAAKDWLGVEICCLVSSFLVELRSAIVTSLPAHPGEGEPSTRASIPSISPLSVAKLQIHRPTFEAECK